MNRTPPPRRLVLASASPRRKELLAVLGFPFDVVVPEVDETPRPGEDPRAYTERLAEAKARTAEAGDRLVVAADTTVVAEGLILGKPDSEDHARAMLRSLSGRTHQVITGVCVRDRTRSVVFSVSTDVEFRKLEAQEVEAYLRTGEPFDKAGAYAIQGGAAHMIRAIRGSHTNVIGLPLCELHETLNSF